LSAVALFPAVEHVIERQALTPRACRTTPEQYFLRDSSAHHGQHDDGDSAYSTLPPMPRRPGGSAGTWRVLRRLVSIPSRWSHSTRERTSAELTTQMSSGRGQALRDAHRTLRQHMEARPALRHVTPHLSVIERALAKHGSRALARLPLPVIQMGLDQLAMLQRENEPTQQAEDLCVLRVRLLEAVARRNPRLRLHDDGPDTIAQHHDPLERGLEVRHISEDEYHQAVSDSSQVGQPPKTRH
jgi:hypothetical protein